MGAETYFSEEENSQEHFGLGVAFCRVLCELVGGRRALRDCLRRGAIAAATLSVGLRRK